MAKAQTAATATPTPATNTVSKLDLNRALPALPAGFESLGTDRLLYKPEKCAHLTEVDGKAVNGSRIYGALLDCVAMNEDDPKNKWHALVVQVKEAVPAVAGSDENDETKDRIVLVTAGEEILIPVTEKLQKLVAFALHPTQMADVIIDVIGKIALPKDKTMWRYRTAMGEPYDRASVSPWATVNRQIENGAESGAASLPAAS